MAIEYSAIVRSLRNYCNDCIPLKDGTFALVSADVAVGGRSPRE